MKKWINGDIIFGIIIIAVSLAFIIGSFQYTGISGDGGPGLFPRLIAIATGLLAAALIVNTVKDMLKNSGEEEKIENSGKKTFYYALIAFALYLIAWKYIHFIICTEIFLLAMCWILKLSKKFAIIYSTVFSVGIYFIFANIFHILL